MGAGVDVRPAHSSARLHIACLDGGRHAWYDELAPPARLHGGDAPIDNYTEEGHDMPKKAKPVAPPQPIEEGSPPAEAVVTEAPAALTTAQVAEQLDTTPRTLRKFLRSKGSGVEPVGQGRRYALSAQSVAKLAERFETWQAREAARRAAEDAETQDDAEGDEPTWSVEELQDMTVSELRDLAHDRGQTVRNKAKKAELVELLAN